MSRAGALLVAALALLALGGPAAGEDLTVAAFGDSITEGCCPEAPPYSYLVKLGNELASWCSPDTCTLFNRGLSAEQTGGGMTRLRNNVIPNPPFGKTWQLIVLMEGTNDIFFNVPVSGIRDNLKIMDQDAIAAGIDVLHASVMQFHPWVYDAGQRPPSCDGSGSLKVWVDDSVNALRTEIINYTNARNRYFADQRNELCPVGLDRHGHNESTCFGPGGAAPFHYNERCTVGHPGNAGFDMLGERFYETMTQSPKPNAVSSLAPANGAQLCGDPATFGFDKGAGEHATFFRIQIDGGAYDEWLQEVDFRAGEPDLCQLDSSGDNSCSLANPLALGSGSHQWRVRGRNPGGFGPWSAQQVFEIFNGAPVAPALFYPGGYTFLGTPTYAWSHDANTTLYHLEVHDGSSWVDAGDFPASAHCSNGSCTATPGAPVLTAGPRSFRVTPDNPCGLGPTSAESPFEKLACGSYPNQDRQNDTETGTETVLACDRIRAGNLGAGPYAIQGAAAEVTFFAGSVIELHNGFSVLADAVFVADTDP